MRTSNTKCEITSADMVRHRINVQKIHKTSKSEQAQSGTLDYQSTTYEEKMSTIFILKNEKTIDFMI